MRVDLLLRCKHDSDTAVSERHTRFKDGVAGRCSQLRNDVSRPHVALVLVSHPLPPQGSDPSHMRAGHARPVVGAQAAAASGGDYADARSAELWVDV